MCVLMCCVCEREGGGGGENGSARGRKCSSACLSGHTIQHREKPFIQHSLPTPPSKLPSNSVLPEWTRWHGKHSADPPPPLLLSDGLCLFFTAFSSFSFCLSSSLHSTAVLTPPAFSSPLLCSDFCLSSCHGTFQHSSLQCCPIISSSLYSFHFRVMLLLLYSEVEPSILSIEEGFFFFFSYLPCSSYPTLLIRLPSSFNTTPFILLLINLSAFL